MTYFALMEKLEKRFDTRELPETLHARFSQSMQPPEEDLDDWADRVQTLANKAYKSMTEHHLTKAIVRFCQRCNDKEAEQSACNIRPKTVDRASRASKHH